MSGTQRLTFTTPETCPGVGSMFVPSLLGPPPLRPSPAAIHVRHRAALGNMPIAAAGGSVPSCSTRSTSRTRGLDEVNGNPTFYFKGSPKARQRRHPPVREDPRLEAARSSCVAGPGRRIRSVASRFQDTWALHRPMAVDSMATRTWPTRATLTIHITAHCPRRDRRRPGEVVDRRAEQRRLQDPSNGPPAT